MLSDEGLGLTGPEMNANFCRARVFFAFAYSLQLFPSFSILRARGRRRYALAARGCEEH